MGASLAEVNSGLAEADDHDKPTPPHGIKAPATMRADVQPTLTGNTLKAYRSDWAEFVAWCEARRLVALPASPETVARYIAELAEVAHVSAVGRRMSSVARAHENAGVPVPSDHATVRAAWSGIRRIHGVAVNSAAPLTVDLLRRTINGVPPGLAGTRDRALLLIGFAGALRRSELVALNVGDVTTVAEGLVVTTRRSTTNLADAGELLGIPYGSTTSTCPVRAVEAWYQAAGISGGPLFRPVDRHGRLGMGRLGAAAVNRLVQRAVARAGLPPGRYSAHSLRAGLAASAAGAGVREQSIMNQTGGRSLTVARASISHGCLFVDNAAAQVGL